MLFKEIYMFSFSNKKVLSKNQISKVGSLQNSAEQIIEFIDFFHSLEDGPQFPLDLALESAETLQKTAASTGEFNDFLLEDSIFASIYATFYEKLFSSLIDNSQILPNLIETFSNSYESREQLIAAQAEKHVQFIKNDGHCNGCSCCDNHKDVVDLVPYWNQQNLDFFL